jgi:epoxyqueuosine reductase
MGGMSLKEDLKARALDVGFDLVGVAPATPGRDLEFAREWAERGLGGEMHYLANPNRFEPPAVLPGVKSVICVGLIYDSPWPYSTEVDSWQSAVSSERNSNSSSDLRFSSLDIPSSDAGRQDADAPRAWISRYAWGRDYHEIMRDKLELLRAAIGELAPGTETRVFVDTGPVSERAFARFSGLGWMGKNTCIINEEKGSWFFLGVILTNLALEPDLPAPDRCGSCRACLDACPTGALVEPYVMDARRCISYLTIELKGSIPQDLRKGVGSNLFGCDICQDVCPWNGKSRSQEPEARNRENSFRPLDISVPLSGVSDQQGRVGSQQAAAGSEPIQNPKSKIQNSPSPQPPAPSTISLFNPPLGALAAMNEDDFRRAFRRSPIKRTKYRGWLRNLCVAMGNSGDARFIPWLTGLASHADPVVREHAAWALERIHNSPDS